MSSDDLDETEREAEGLLTAQIERGEMRFKIVEWPERGVLVVPESLFSDLSSRSAGLSALMSAFIRQGEENGVMPPIVVTVPDGQSIEALGIEQVRSILEQLEARESATSRGDES